MHHQLHRLLTVGRQDEKLVGIPDVVIKMAELDQTRHEQMAGLLVIGNAPDRSSRTTTNTSGIWYEAGIDPLAIEGVESGAANQFQLNLLHTRFTKQDGIVHGQASQPLGSYLIAPFHTYAAAVSHKS